MALIPINFAAFQAGSVNPSGVYVSDSNLHIGAKTSPFIAVKTGVTYTIKIQYDLNKLTGISTTWAWGRVYSYDSNYEPIAQIGGYNEVVSWKTYEIITQISNNVKYIRFSTSHIANNAVTITVTSDEIEDEIEDGKTILKLYANGNFELVDTTLIQSDISGNYSFSENAITVPKIIKYPSYRNYFVEKTSVQGHLNGSNGTVQWGAEYDLTSDFIAVATGEQIAIRVGYTGIINARPWITSCYYNANKEFVSTPLWRHVLVAGAVDGEYTDTVTIPDGVAYVRLSFNLFFHPTTKVKVSIEKASVATVVHQPAIEDLTLPEWVEDTGNPINFFPQGVVIKGDLIQTGLEPEPEPPISDILFEDDFNRTDLGDNWTATRGSWAIENNVLKPTGVSNILLCEHSLSDNVSISADVTRNLSEGIIFRGIDTNNHLYVQFEQQHLRLKSITNGTVTQLVTYNLNSVTTKSYRTRIELRGAEIKVYVDDTLQITHETNAYLNNNLCGFQSWSDGATNGRFDNFEIRALPLEPDSLLFKDDFNRPNSGNLGGNWTALSGGFSIVSNKAINHPVTPSNSVVVTDVGTQNHISIGVDILNLNELDGISFRVVDVNNRLTVQINNGSVALRSIVDGKITILKSVEGGYLRFGSCTLRVELRDEEIKVFVNDELKITHTDALFVDSTKCGLTGYSMDYTSGHFDNYEVHTLPIEPVLFKDDFNRAD